MQKQDTYKSNEVIHMK